VCYLEIGKQRTDVFCAALHPCLLGDFMAQYYQGLMASLSDGITNVFDCLPFCRFSSQQNFNIVTAKREHLLLQS
jgi:hypothetical protein